MQGPGSDPRGGCPCPGWVRGAGPKLEVSEDVGEPAGQEHGGELVRPGAEGSGDDRASRRLAGCEMEVGGVSAGEPGRPARVQVDGAGPQGRGLWDTS